MTLYRTYRIEPMGEQFLVKTAGMYGYHYFPTMEAAKGMIDIWWEFARS